MANNGVSQHFKIDGGLDLSSDSQFATLSANTKIVYKPNSEKYVKNPNYSNVFDKAKSFVTDEELSDTKTELGTVKSKSITAIDDANASGVCTCKNASGTQVDTFTCHVSKSASNPTLSWGSTATIGTIDGTAFKVTMPANPNTDTKAVVVNNAPTLSWGQTSTVGSVDGTSLTVTMPGNPNTDIKEPGDVIIDGYVTGSGSFDDDGNCRITVIPNISDTPSAWYVGKTNAADKWGDDENGNPWGSTADHPFASLSYAINQTNNHTFPGNTIDINIVDGGDYNDSSYSYLNITSNTNVKAALSSNPAIRCSYEISFGNNVDLAFDGVDFKCSIATSEPINGQTFFRCYGSGTISFVNGCHMIIDNNNFGANAWGFLVLYDNVELGLYVHNNKPALYLELENAGTTIADSYCIYFADKSGFSAMSKYSSDPNLVINAPAGTKIVGATIRVGRSGDVSLFNASNIHDGIREKFLIDWNIADDSELRQVLLHKYAYLGLRKNAAKGRALPGSSVGTVSAGADYEQADA